MSYFIVWQFMLLLHNLPSASLSGAERVSVSCPSLFQPVPVACSWLHEGCQAFFPFWCPVRAGMSWNLWMWQPAKWVPGSAHTILSCTSAPVHLFHQVLRVGIKTEGCLLKYSLITIGQCLARLAFDILFFFHLKSDKSKEQFSLGFYKLYQKPWTI